MSIRHATANQGSVSISLAAAAPGETVTFHEGTVAQHALVPPEISGYEILREVGRGAMGVVYEARQVAVARRLVALKVIPAAVAPSGSVGRLRAEIVAAARLQHPHIVPVYDVGTCESGTYLAMELVLGGSLGDALGGKNLLPTETVVRIMLAVAEAIEHAHQQGVIHRDVKPANVLRTVAGAPKVADFGLAKVLGDTSHLTAAGDILGTPSYMSPEQARGDAAAIGPQTDIYALGATLYALLTGRPPFAGHSTMDTLQQVLTEEPLAVRKLNSLVPRDLETICSMCLKKEPWRRYQTARAFAEDLQRFAEGRPIHARPVRTPERVLRWASREPMKALLAAAVMVAVVVGASGVVWQWRAAVVARADAVQNATSETAARRSAEANLYFYGITLAERERQANNSPGMRAVLAECPSLLRRWEWHYLQALADPSLATFRGEAFPIWSVSWSPDGSLLAAGGGGSPGVRLWNTHDGQHVLDLGVGVSGAVRGTTFSPDGRFLLAVSDGGSLDVWNARTGEQCATRRVERPQPLYSVSVSRDGTRVATGGAGGAVAVWDTAEGTCVQSCTHGTYVLGISFSPDGTLLASGSDDQTVKVWEVVSGTEVRTLKGHGGIVRAVAFSPDGTLLASGSDDQTVRVWEVATGMEVQVLRGHGGMVSSVVFHPDGKRVISGSDDRTVRVWQWKSGTVQATYQGHAGTVASVAVRPDGTRIASGGYDRAVKVWDGLQGPDAVLLAGHGGGTTGVAFSPDGQLLVSSGLDQTVRIWDVARRREQQVFTGHRGEVTCVSFSPSKGLLASGSDDQTVKVWEVVSGTEVRTLKGHGGIVRAVAFSPDGTLLASGSDDQTVRVWEVATGMEVQVLRGHGGMVSSVVFHPDGKRVISGSDDRTVRVWQWKSGTVQATYQGHTKAVWCVATVPGRRIIVSGDGAGEVHLWDSETGVRVRSLTAHGGKVTSVSCWPCGTRLVSGGADRVLKVWDADSGRALLTLHGHSGSITWCAVSPDGTVIASASKDKTLRLWGARTTP